MAGDEGRFGRFGEVRACWCPSGIRPTVPKQQVRQHIYAYKEGLKNDSSPVLEIVGSVGEIFVRDEIF